MPYTTDPTNTAAPADTDNAGVAAAELRALKGYLAATIATLNATIASQNSTIASLQTSMEELTDSVNPFTSAAIGMIYPIVRSASNLTGLSNFLLCDGKLISATGNTPSNPAHYSGADYEALFRYLWDVATEQRIHGVSALDSLVFEYSSGAYHRIVPPSLSGDQAWAHTNIHLAVPDLCGRVIRGHNPNARVADASDPDALWLEGPDSGRIRGTRQSGSILVGDPVGSTLNATGLRRVDEDPTKNAVGWDTFAMYDHLDTSGNAYPYLPMQANGGADHLSIGNQGTGTNIGTVANQLKSLGIARMANYALPYYIRYK